LYNTLFGWLESDAFGSAVAATVLVYLQAIMTNSLVDRFRLMTDRNWLPGLCYALVASMLPDFQFLSAPLVAATFIILALEKAFQTYKHSKSAVLVFDTALWTAVAALFFPPALWLSIIMLWGIGRMRSWSTRDLLAFVAGTFTPLFLAWVGYFWADSGSIFRSRHVAELFEILGENFYYTDGFWVKAGLFLFVILNFLLNYGSLTSNKSMHGQKCVTVLFSLLLLATGLLFLQEKWHWQPLLMTASSLGILLAMNFHNMRPRFAELLHLVLLAAVLCIQWLHFNS
jgi:hypothetical protein